MDERVTVERIAQHEDVRGVVFEPASAAELPAQRNVHVVLTLPGHVRGNHVHALATEILVVRGPARVRWRESGATREEDVASGELIRLTIPPHVPHAVLATGPEPCIAVGFSTRAHDPAHPDVERVELF